MTEVLNKQSSTPIVAQSQMQQDSSCECRQCVARSVSPKARKSTSPVTAASSSRDSNHPNLASSGGVCSCSDNMDKDLDELIFCIMMLVVEGRSSNGSKFQHGESIHAKPLIDNLIKKVLCLNQMAAAGTSAAKVASDARYLVPSKLTNVSLQQQLDCHGAQTEHVCSNRLNTQCRIAVKLKEKVEKCIESHLIIANNDQESNNAQQSDDISPATLLLNSNRKIPFVASIQQRQSQQLAQHATTTQTKIRVHVYLLPDCCYGETLASGGDNLLDSQNLVDHELLESWTINMISNQNSEQSNKVKLLTLNELFQAIRSYLHFSQISSWINQSGGQQPKNIAYSVDYSSEKCTTQMDESAEQFTPPVPTAPDTANPSPRHNSHHFDFQTFPSLNLLLANNKFYVASAATQSQPNLPTRDG